MNVRLRHNMSFTAGVYYGDEMRMNHYNLCLHMTTNSTDPVSHNVAFERIKYFVYNKLDSTIFINSQHQAQCEKFLSAGLSVTTMPGEPVDQLVGLMLYYKLNAVMEDRIIIDETEISSMLGENMIYLHSDIEQTDVTDPPAWWSSLDLVHSDYVSLDADKILTMRAGGAWRDLDLSWPETETSDASGNIVVFANFKSDHEAK
jgi:hypothetical protein